MAHKIWCNLLVIAGSFLVLPVVVKGGYDKEDDYDIEGNKDMEGADYDDINERDFHGNNDDCSYGGLFSALTEWLRAKKTEEDFRIIFFILQEGAQGGLSRGGGSLGGDSGETLGRFRCLSRREGANLEGRVQLLEEQNRIQRNILQRLATDLITKK